MANKTKIEKEKNLLLEVINKPNIYKPNSINLQANGSENIREKNTLNNVNKLEDNLESQENLNSAITIDTVDKRPRRLNQDHSYAAKKTVAQGMMDIALITANANQLKHLIEYQRSSATFYVNVTLIVISLVLQIVVGISLIFRGRFDMQGKSKSAQARRINNYVVVGVFLITIINVFVAAFSVSPANPIAPISPIPPAVASPTNS